MSRIIVALRVKASPARAFEAFTQEIAAWWRPDPLLPLTPRGDGALRFEPGPDGRLVTRLASGKEHELGRILAWEPPHRLMFAWRPAALAPGLSTEVEVRFDAVGGETRVTVEHRHLSRIPPEHALRHGFPEGRFLELWGQAWRAGLARLASAVTA